MWQLSDSCHLAHTVTPWALCVEVVALKPFSHMSRTEQPFQTCRTQLETVCHTLNGKALFASGQWQTLGIECVQVSCISLDLP